MASLIFTEKDLKSLTSPIFFLSPQAQNKKICKSSEKICESSVDEEEKFDNFPDVTSTNIELDNALNGNKFLKQINSELLTKIDELTTRLHKYTNGENHKRYYEKNKEKIKQSGATYLQKLKAENPEKIKEYSKRAYANKKKKMNDMQLLEPITPPQPGV